MPTQGRGHVTRRPNFANQIRRIGASPTDAEHSSLSTGEAVPPGLLKAKDANELFDAKHYLEAVCVKIKRS